MKAVLFLFFLFFIFGYAIDVRGPTIGTSYAIEGQKVSLDCLVTNSSSADNVYWTKIGELEADNINLFLIYNNGETVSDGFPNEFPNPSNYNVTVKNISSTQFWCNMTILNISQIDLGEYTCYSYNTQPPPVEGNGSTLEFAELPKSLVILNSPNDEARVIENVPDTLNCTSYGSKPEVSIHWTIDGVSEDEDTSDYYKDDAGYFTTYSKMTYTYNRANNGKLVGCEATNIAGTTDQTTVALDVLFPASITNLDKDNEFVNEGGEAILKCEAEGNPPPGFTWTKDNTVINGSEGHIVLYVSDPAGFARNSTLTIGSVNPGRDYEDYICNAANPYGYGILTINLNGTTVPEPATEVNVTSATDTSITVTWTEGQDGGNPQNFTVEYRVYGSNEVWKDSRTVDNPPLTLTNLQPQTEYQIKVRSNNKLGYVHSESIVYTTDPLPKDPPSFASSSTPIIIGVCIGGGLLITIIIIVIVIFRQKSKKADNSGDQEITRAYVEDTQIDGSYHLDVPDNTYAQIQKDRKYNHKKVSENTNPIWNSPQKSLLILLKMGKIFQKKTPMKSQHNKRNRIKILMVWFMRS